MLARSFSCFISLKIGERHWLLVRSPTNPARKHQLDQLGPPPDPRPLCDIADMGSDSLETDAEAFCDPSRGQEMIYPVIEPSADCCPVPGVPRICFLS